MSPTPSKSVASSWRRADVKLLVDSMLPETVESEAPPGVEVIRWSQGEASDEDLMRAGARAGARAVVFLDRRSLYQPGLRELSNQLGVAIVAIEAHDPIEAKERLFLNLDRVRKVLTVSQAVLVLAHEAKLVVDDG